jgi:hypothetical protein
MKITKEKKSNKMIEVKLGKANQRIWYNLKKNVTNWKMSLYTRTKEGKRKMVLDFCGNKKSNKNKNEFLTLGVK